MGHSVNCCGDTRPEKVKRPLAKFKRPMRVKDAKEMTGDSGDVDDLDLEDHEQTKEITDISVIKSNGPNSEKQDVSPG